MQTESSSPYTIELPVFTGPFDLLLHLIERNELDITAVSLAKVTEQYLAQVERLKEGRVEQLMSFLVIGARLLAVKSSALLPQMAPEMASDENVEDPAEALARQLRTYRRFKEAGTWLKKREGDGLRTYLRLAPAPRIEGTLDLRGITVQTLAEALLGAVARAEMLEESLSVAMGNRNITVERQIRHLRERIQFNGRVFFGELLSAQITWHEVSVTLLAVLELIKRHEVLAHQPVLFGPIEIVAPNGID